MASLMRLILLLLGLWISGTQAMTLEQWKQLVVKIKTTEGEGSGVAIKALYGPYVLTSEHVVWPSDHRYFTVTDRVGSTRYSHQVVSSYFHGLAMMYSAGPADTEWLKTDFTMLYDHHKGREFYALGFPAGSKDLRVVGPGQLTEVASRRALIPGVEEVHELTNLPVDFGMSGGILLMREGEDKYVFAGIISHQFLNREGGRPTEIRQLGDGSQSMAPTDLTFAIPTYKVRSWFIDKGASRGIQFERAVSAVDNLPQITFGPLVFRQVRMKPHQIETAVGGRMTIGGADGSGVGGKAQVTSNEATMIEISPNPRWKTFVDTPALPEEMRKLNETLVRRRKLYVLRLVDKDGEIKPVSSVDQFITYWQRDGMRPVLFAGTLEEGDKNLALRKAKTATLRTAIWQMRKQALTAPLHEWLERLIDDTYLVDNQLLDPKILRKYMIEPVNTQWSSLLLTDFDAVIEMESALVDLVENANL